MSDRGVPARLLLGLAALTAAAVAVVGGLALRPPGLLAVGLASVVTACLAAGVARESAVDPRADLGILDRRSPLEAAWRVGAATIGVLLFLSGTAAVGGPVLTVLAGAVLTVGGLGLWLLRTGRPPRRDASPPAARAAGGAPPAAAPSPLTGARPGETVGTVTYLPPVATLSTAALGREWLSTTTALAGQLHPAARQSIVRRRQETLDELERRDPAGFARWLAEASPRTDPAGYLSEGPSAA
ncbi:hypothetical protein SAMN04488107_3538 [Geodermatophilus saharensis]|uniref:Uncharacterized protein n=1 Tax=Geodermatophilus saharensis TaxID=1137994 RepID=A0A239GRM2_9ACTN|nr:hypothetical protein [Geodermatophilus saharensis]SNS71611.1 hypothetical protein SAMN04488107_3538 [Geodermatophilus saharensis]